ncbi:MAG TPA: FAD-dependent oxidoreductase [Acidimicrobiales bacterium]|nr:FAD-dependent oxidoreductase [Acidimicrobiales bacterium]
MNSRLRVVIVGGNPGGMAAISQIRKGRPEAEIVVLERGRWTSYSACGVPYLVGGVVSGGPERLVARSPEAHRRSGTDVRLHHEATALDLTRREVEVFDGDSGSTYRLGFDHLHLAMGGRPLRPPLPGIDLPFVYGVQTLDDATELLAAVERRDLRQVVVVGSGYIGLEIAEAFVERKAAVVVVEQAAQPMPASLDPEMGALVAEAMTRFGIDVRLGVEAVGFEEGVVHTTAGPLPADLVLLGIGVGPRSELAESAGLPLGPQGAIRVDDRQATPVAGVWSAGDCCQSTHLVTGQPVHVALGTVANKQGRVAGVNIGGGEARFPGVLGTAISKICETEVARTGLNMRQAAEAGLDACAVSIEATTAAGYWPGTAPLTVRMVVERGAGRVLGAQIVGGAGSAKRIDTCATAITARMDVQQVVDLDLAYAPPFSSVWDPVAVAAREALKQI